MPFAGPGDDAPSDTVWVCAHAHASSRLGNSLVESTVSTCSPLSRDRNETPDRRGMTIRQSHGCSRFCASGATGENIHGKSARENSIDTSEFTGTPCAYPPGSVRMTTRGSMARTSPGPSVCATIDGALTSGAGVDPMAPPTWISTGTCARSAPACAVTAAPMPNRVHGANARFVLTKDLRPQRSPRTPAPPRTASARLIAIPGLSERTGRTSSWRRSPARTSRAHRGSRGRPTA